MVQTGPRYSVSVLLTAMCLGCVDALVGNSAIDSITCLKPIVGHVDRFTDWYFCWSCLTIQYTARNPFRGDQAPRVGQCAMAMDTGLYTHLPISPSVHGRLTFDVRWTRVVCWCPTVALWRGQTTARIDGSGIASNVFHSNILQPGFVEKIGFITYAMSLYSVYPLRARSVTVKPSVRQRGLRVMKSTSLGVISLYTMSCLGL